MPEKYRRKPVVIEAMQWTGENADAVIEWTGEATFQAALDGADDPSVTAMLWVAAGAGWTPVVNGDWILRDDLCFYVCPNSTFQRGYDRVEAAQDTYERLMESWRQSKS